MDESGDFKFTSREKLLELGRMMELSGSELEEFVVEQQEYEQRMREEKREHEQWMKELEESERQAELEHKRWVKEMEDRERQAKLEHEQKIERFERNVDRTRRARKRAAKTERCSRRKTTKASSGI